MEFKTLVSTKTLHQHLDDPNWAIFDIRFELNQPEQGQQEYLKGHIPGAIYAHLEKDLSLPASPLGGRHPLPSVEALVQTFSRWGIEREVQVVAYDSRGAVLQRDYGGSCAI